MFCEMTKALGVFKGDEQQEGMGYEVNLASKEHFKMVSSECFEPLTLSHFKGSGQSPESG